ncbi:HD domain-containing protein [Thermoleophilia bacterium SCSIO 60948]|nr:HD domain-containing protein [Thermoleophilia bacterium SCSIO 60948]
MAPTAGQDLARRVAATPAVAALRSALDPSAEAWVVGGAVRDAALGRPVVDVDLALHGDVERAARTLADATGRHAFELSSEFRTWRVVDREGWSADIAALRADSIEADLGLRDFTLNAVAVPVSGDSVLDPTGGLDDLAEARLRAAGPSAFADDPLRILRGARLAGTLALEIEPETARLANASADRAGEAAGERQLAELRGLICGPDPLRGLDALDELGGTPRVLPELEALKGLEQNPNHHLDAHGHTLAVLAMALEIESDLERFAPGEGERAAALLAEPLADEMTRGEALRFGALVHDWGKPHTRGERDGWIIFPGHDEVGAELIGDAFRRLRSSRALRSHLEALTRHHLRLGFLARERPLPPRTLYAYLAATAPVAADVTLLTVADRLSARGGGATATEAMIEAHLALAAEVMPAALDWHFEGRPASPLDGAALQALGVAPGPRLGGIMEELAAAEFAGELDGDGAAERRARELAAE